MDEHQIERVAKALGARAADRLDVDRLAAGVVARLRADRATVRRPARVWWSSPAMLRLAAAVAVLVTGGVLVREALENGSEPAAVMIAPVLRDLSADELMEVFDSLGVEAPVHEGVAIGLESLNEAQLNELLRLLEG
ncbi:MAG: hypothetical protein HYW06_07440 [Gemmatimonadetes bacterium]|nr:hypothetical protein [Gemmatimonadota bacterium]MBI2536781.1 hypothetical protein [Gemmatimonadota bacterium]